MAYRTYRAKLLMSAAAAVVTLAASAPALAQIEEIVVTARKKEETLQSAPIAVTAFTGEVIAQRGITDLNDLARFTPGLSFSQAFGRSTDRPVIRGQSNVLAGVQFGVESGTAYFVDGIYYPGDIQSFDLNQVERVEVIKGPQSALYGRNTYAGAINYITRTPTNEWQGNAKLLLAEYDERELAVGIRGPLVQDKVFLGLNARYFEYGGQYTNQLTGQKVGFEESRSVAGTLYWRASENFSARLRAQYARDDDGPLALFLLPANELNCRPGFRSPFYRIGGVRVSNNQNQYYCGVIQPRPELVQLNTDPLADGTRDGTAFDGVENTQYLSSLALDYDVGGSGYVLTSLTGWRWNENLFGTDSDHSDAFVAAGPPTVEPLFANTNRNLTRDWSQEFRIASPTSDRLRWLTGAYYYYQRDEEVDITYASGPNGLPFGSPGSNFTTTENTALFGLVTWDFAEGFSATAEVRWAVETKTRQDFGTAGAVTFNGEEKYQSVTPRLTLDYQVNEDLLFYGIYAQGVKPGGINGAVGIPVGFPFYEQEESDNYELGVKSTLFGGLVQANLALYWIEAESVQLTTALPSPTGGAITSIATNQGAAEIKGLEAELNAAPVEGLGLGISYSWTDATFTRGCDDFEYVLNSGGRLIPPGYNGPLCDISGKRLPLGSEHKFSANANWTAPINDRWSWYTGADYTYESSKYVQVHNLAETGDTHMVGARLGVRTDNWQLQLFGRNLLDEDSIPLATRWFDLRHGFAPRNITPAQFALRPDTGLPRAFFAALRKGRTFGIEARYTY